MPYRVTCSTCRFHEIVEELDDVLFQQTIHQSEFGEDHAMSFEVVDEPPLFRGGVSDDWE